MRGFPIIFISIVSALFIVQAVSGNTISVTQMPALYVSDYGNGVTHPINSYTLQPNGAIPDGAWMLLATNDQTTFTRIDARKDIAFSAGETMQFDVANSESFRWYYLYFQGGFTVGSQVEFHLNELSPPPSPTPSHTNSVKIAIEGVPLIVIADFDKKSMNLKYYTFTSSETLPDSQSWQLFGTNDPRMLGSDNPGALTLLDDQSGIGFASGVSQQFDVITSSDFLYYVFYLQGGFSVRGMNLEIQFHESQSEPTPTTTPTVTPTPTPPNLPVVDFEGSPRAGVVPLQVTFTDNSTGTISNWYWDFGDGYTSSEENPTHIYSQAGAFRVNLTACNDDGCSWLSRNYYIYTTASSPTETPQYYIRIGGGSSGSSSKGSSQGAQSPAGSGVGVAQSDGSAGTSPESGTSKSNGVQGSQGTGVQGSQGTGDTAGQEKGMPNPEQPQPAPTNGISALMDALGDIVTVGGNLLAFLQDQLRSLLGL